MSRVSVNSLAELIHHALSLGGGLSVFDDGHHVAETVG